MLDSGRHREVYVGHHALMQQQQLGRNRLTSAADSVGHRCELAIAGGSEFADTGHHGHFPPYLPHHSKTL